MSDLDQRLRELFRGKESVVGPTPATPPELLDPAVRPGEPSRPRTVRWRHPLIQTSVIVAVAALVVVGVSVVRSNVTPAPDPAARQTWAQALGDVEPLTVPNTLPDLDSKTNLPTSVPGPDEDLPSLLDDLPGRVQMTWYLAPPSGCDVQGWARESIDFYGVDGRWRRLNMADLGLPESSWPGCDTYGSGSLSPDGRWWATGAKDLFVLLNLETGNLVTRRSTAGWPGLWAESSQQLVTAGMRAGSLWRVPGIHLTDTPGLRESHLAWPLPDGGYVIDEDTRSDDPDGGSMTLRYYSSTGDLSNTREVPIPPGSGCSLEGLQGERVGMFCMGKPNREPHFYYVLDESSWRVVAALEVPPQGSDTFPAGFLNPGLWVLDNGESVGMWEIDEGQMGTVLALPDEPKSAKWYAFNQFGLAGDLVRSE